MSDECKNNCTTPLSFPLRPGKDPSTAHGDDCFCCSLDDRVAVNNRPALPHFNYRIGTYGSIREWLFNRINQTPNLQNWTHRAPDDPAVALLEGAAILGDILTFYQETYANEAFLRTARERESIADLVRLLGYRLSPSLGGSATFAFEIKNDEPVTVPAGFPLKATLEDFDDPSIFETSEEITAYPRLSRFNLFRPLDTPKISPGQTTEFYIHSPEQLLSPIELKAGERLIVGRSDINNLTQPNELKDEFKNTEVVIIDSVREQHGTKIYKIKGNLKQGAEIESLAAYRLGRTFHHFGRNNPPSMADPTQPITSTASVANGKTTTSSTITSRNVPLVKSLKNDLADTSVSIKLRPLEFPLDAEVPDLAGNTPMIFEFNYSKSPSTTVPTHISLVRSITDVRSTSLTWGVISGTASILQISRSLNDNIDAANVIDNEMYITDALFHEATSPLFELRRVKAETAELEGNTLKFYGTAEQVTTLNGRRIMLEKPGTEPRVLTVTQVPSAFDASTKDFPLLHPISLSEKVKYADFPNEDPVVTVYGNIADADEGKTLPEAVLGDGDATLVFQNFKLPKAPLTYHLVPENTPSETPEAQVYVDGQLWTKVDSFFNHQPDEHIYIVREDEEGNSWVQFGDGKTGARPTSGVENVTAVYRTGSGAYGLLKADTDVQASAKLKNLDKIQMPKGASSGSPPEDGENARQAAPGKIQSLDRIVSLKDLEAEAAAIPGVVSASAKWQLMDNVPAMVVTVLMETGRSKEIGAVRDTLSSYNNLRGAGRNAVEVELGKRMYVTVSVQCVLKPEFRIDLTEPAIRRALGVNFGKVTREEDQTGLFSLRKRQFGRSEYASSIEGVTQNVEGVLWAKTTAFTMLSDADDPGSITPAGTAVLDPTVNCDPGHILSLYDKHLFLTFTAGGGS